jgi:hypothetical protein
MRLSDAVLASELADYLDEQGGVHLHRSSNGWMLVGCETATCKTPVCFILRFKVNQANGRRIEEASR